MEHEKALLLNTEIAAVVTAMRQNSKWAVIPRYTDEDIGDDPLLEEFKSLRRKVFRWTDWSSVDALEYLGPFLEVVRSAETSGPITAMALSSINKLLLYEIIGFSAGSDQGLAVAMHSAVEAVTHCKFESTDTASDEFVLSRILQVLLACLKCPTGHYLSDSDVCNIFQACFRIGHGHPPGKEGELLTQMSRAILSEMVSIIFARLPELREPPPAASPDPQLDAHKIHSVSGMNLSSLAEADMEPGSHNAAGLEDCSAEPDTLKRGSHERAGACSVGSSESTEDVQDMAYPKPEQHHAASGSDHRGTTEQKLSLPTGAGPGTLVTIANDPDSNSACEESNNATPPASPREWRGYGIGCATEVLGFIVSLVGANGPEADEIRVFGLELINNALSSGRCSFLQHESLMEILQTDLLQAMHRAARSSNLAALAGSCSVSLSLYVHLGKRMLLQLEAFIETVLLRIAEGKACTYEQQEAALEGILDLCHQARFIRDAYANLDCRIERSNVFEDICGLLSKTAFPVNCPLRSVHLISLEGLLAVLNTLSSMVGLAAEDETGILDSEQSYPDLWSALVEGREPLHAFSDPSNPAERDVAWVAAVRSEKYLKGRLTIAADHFNRDPKKGFHFLQTCNLLPDPLEPKAVACFLRACPGLHKKNIGTLLGEVHLKSKDKDNFYIDVLQHFSATFDFTGMTFDGALRLYLESFQLPGEAQKIDRIVNCFGTRYHQQNPGVLRTADAAYVLGYSVIMLNTDAHNDQVKKKMTVDQFKRNNRGINDGANLPDDFQEDLYLSIVTSAIKLQDSTPGAGSGSVMSAARWAELRRASLLPRGQLSRRGPGVEAFDRDMFCLIWGPTVAAVSVVLDHADDPATVEMALDGLMLAARIAAHHKVDEVMDSLVVSLCKFTALLNPVALKPRLVFGEDFKSRLAAESVFALANRYGDCLRAGWRNVLDCVVRVHKLGLLPPAVFLMEGEDEGSSLRRIPSAQIRPAKGNANMLGIKWSNFSLNQIISFDDGNGSGTPTQREGEAEQATLKCVEACRIDEVFSDSKFLRAESLLEFVKAIIWAAGLLPSGHSTNAVDSEDTDTAELCLELLIGVTIRNRDRIELLWPLVHSHLETVIVQGSHPAGPLVERAVLGLLRVCQRLLPYKEDIADELLRSLHLIFKLDPKVAEDLAVVITGEVLGLVKTSAAYIQNEWGWKTVCMLLKAASHHTAARPMAFEALGVITQEEHLVVVNFLPCLETAMSFIENANQQEMVHEQATQVLDVLESMNSWLVSCAEVASDSADKDTYSGMWLLLIQSLSKVCIEGDPTIRNHSVVLLHRVVSPELHEGLGLQPSTWGTVFQDVLLPLVSDLAALLQLNGHKHSDLDRTLRLAVNMLTKSLLQSLPVLRKLPAFPDIWISTLTALQDCTKNHSEELAEAVPENLKNMLRCMSHQQVLVPTWVDSSGASLWELTWKKSQAISTGLTVQVLDGAVANTMHAPT